MTPSYEKYTELWQYIEDGYKSSLLLPKEWSGMRQETKVRLIEDMTKVVEATLSYDRYMKLRRAARHEGAVKPFFKEDYDLSKQGWDNATFYSRRNILDKLIETKGSTPKCDPDHENFYPETWGNW
jgi:hypothetical protein